MENNLNKGNAILQARNRSLGGRWIENMKAEKGYSIRWTKRMGCKKQHEDKKRADFKQASSQLQETS